MQRRDTLRFLASAPMALSTLSAAHAQPASASWSIGANLGVVDWAPSPFVDVVKSSRGFGRPDEWDENSKLKRDARGWPLEPSRIVITAVHERPGTEWPAGTWKGRYRGPGKLVDSPLGASRLANVKRQGDVVTFDWEVTGLPFLSLTFDGAISDLQIVRPGHDLDKHPLLHDDALAYYKPFHTLRFVDFMGQNDSDHLSETSWAQRQPAGKWHGRKSWEAMARWFTALYEAPGSRVKAIWFNVPFRFGEDDVLQLGRFLKTALPPKAIKFVEFSNELWNSIYTAKWEHFKARANDARDRDYALVNAPAADEWQRMARLWGLQVARMARAMKTAFPDEFGTTLVPVMAGQAHGIHWHRDIILPWLSQPAQVAAFGGLPRTYIGSLAAAPYLGGSRTQLDEARDGKALLQGMRKGFDYSLDKTVPVLKAWKQLQRQHGIARLDAYEWQLHPEGNANAAAKLAASQDAEAGALIKDQAFALRDAGFQTMCFLSGMPQKALASDVNSFLWALNESFGGPPSAKLKAVRELIAASNP